jgi:magnesium-transporting ATPase (P-type)
LHVLAENIAQALTLLIGLAVKDSRGLSVFPLAPVQILWIIIPPISLEIDDNTSARRRPRRRHAP